MLHNPNSDISATRPKHHRVTPKVRRAFQAADIYRGPKPTVKELAAIFGVSPAYIRAAVKASDDFVMRMEIMHGNAPLVATGKREHVKPELKPESLTAHILRATPAQRIEAARAIGPSTIWDTMVNPLL
jgi:hypothetical protein